MRSRCLLLLTTLLCVTLSDSLQAAEKPNIVFVFADDQCFDTLASLGNTEIQTPNLDQLARRGTTFTHSFNMGSWSGAVCVASRTMLNTGRYVWNANAVYNNSEQERREGRWWSEMMKSAGYRTYMTGKWHCKADAKKAFDVARDVRPGMPSTVPQAYDRPAADGSDPWSPSDPKFGGFWEGGTHWSEIVANHADDFLSEAASRDEPFFMYLAFNAPHDPRQSPQSYVDRYPADSILMPPNFQPLYPFAKEIGCGPTLRDEKLAPFPRTPHSVQVHRGEYYALITHTDAMIGRILEAIEQTGKAENTWIFFTADHGLACGQHGLMGKQNMYDHSVRVPFIVVGPGVKAGEQIHQPIYLQDVMPTTLELAGVEKPAHVEFQSLLPTLAGEERPRQPIYGCYLDKQRSIRTDQYKLIAYPNANVVRLYDLQQDPDEITDLAGKPAMKTTVHRLFAALQKLQKSMNDDLDLSHLAVE
ncbi:sulfatase-like hydrolase/transferase [Novipirellula artificiosorum]|uniref:Arylsulfatase n=1 Tax=Novipirellula artificiosorum TaxID=2528016 RepID=A0A5C6DQF9_9BACT|nr:sulfatase-like hydrolase/transferase [Novipirellula artificiosorum]TWU37256.1 Arylsulfatase [Novipirellula artificiosorum]